MERCLLQKDLEEALSLRPGTISQYERGLREPGFDMLLTIADMFAVSIDYMLGRPEALKESPALGAARRQLQAVLDQAAASGGVRLPEMLQLAEQVAPDQFGVQRLAQRLWLKPGMLIACRSGISSLPQPTLADLARHLGVPPEWLREA